MICKECITRGKTWNGGDPVCGFDETGNFTGNNWNCATLNTLRQIADENDFVLERLEDTYIAVIPYDDDGWIVLSWYKTGTARFIDDTDEMLTLEIAEQAIKQYCYDN